MMNYVIVFLCLIFLSFTDKAIAAGPNEQFKIGNWIGGSYTSESDGTFSHCVAWATYNSNITLYVTITHQGGWNLGFANDNWNLSTGSSIPIDLSFDGGPPLELMHFLLVRLWPLFRCQLIQP